MQFDRRNRDNFVDWLTIEQPEKMEPAVYRKYTGRVSGQTTDNLTVFNLAVFLNVPNPRAHEILYSKSCAEAIELLVKLG